MEHADKSWPVLQTVSKASSEANPAGTVRMDHQLGDAKGQDTWTQLFQGNRLAAKGMTLNFITPVLKNG